MNWTLFVPPVWPLTNALARWFYQSRSSVSAKLDCPVISVGNILAGGVGKTELVVWLAQYLTAQGKRVCVASRGYRSKWETMGGVSQSFLEAKGLEFPDEALLLLKRVPNVWVSVGQERANVLRTHWSTVQPDVVLLDDGFQHFKLARDLDILVHDFSVKGLFRDFSFMFSNAGVRVAFSEVPSSLRKLGWTEVRYELKGTLPSKARVFCGIGNPKRFLVSLKAKGVDVQDYRFFSDHHRYDAATLTELLRWIDSYSTPVLTTLKDFVKLPEEVTKKVQYVETDLRFLNGQEGMLKAIEKVLKQ